MLETTLSKCAVCGFAGCEGSCDRCGTILADGKVSCDACGNSLAEFSFECDHCGKRMGDEERDITPEKDKTIQHFLLVPGMTKEDASGLYEDGVKDLASLIGMSLTDSLREEGLHHVIARRMMMLDAPEKDDQESTEDTIECRICRTVLDASSERCDICGHLTTIGLDRTEEEQAEKCHPSIGGIYKDICTDVAFKDMPEDFREELSEVLTNTDMDDSTELDELDFDEEDFDLSEIEEIIEEEELLDEYDEALKDLSSLGSQIMVCPMCETEVQPHAHFCHNCGVKFSEE